MWQAILEIGAEIWILIEDLKFWKKKKARRKLEKEKGLPRKTMISPDDYYFGILAIVFILSLIIFIFVKSWYTNPAKQKEKFVVIERLLEAEKKYQGKYPVQLKNLIRKNPLHQHIELDAWGNAYSYEVGQDNNTYILQSKGKDGVLNTEDDIILKR